MADVTDFEGLAAKLGLEFLGSLGQDAKDALAQLDPDTLEVVQRVAARAALYRLQSAVGIAPPSSELLQLDAQLANIKAIGGEIIRAGMWQAFHDGARLAGQGLIEGAQLALKLAKP